MIVERFEMESLYDNLSIAWNGDYESLKCFVEKDLNLDGIWEQPVGNKEIFKSNNILISWRKNKNLLHLELRRRGWQNHTVTLFEDWSEFYKRCHNKRFY